MSAEVVKFAFIAGEISPTLFGRSDLTKYDLGMAEAHNFFVDYRGGLSSRPGFEFCDFVLADDKPTRMIPFTFNPDLENTYVVLFGDEYVRFLQDGAYVLEDDIAITSIVAGLVTAPAHGLSAGRWVKINGRTFEVRNPTTDTFRLYVVPAGTFLNEDLSASTLNTIYEIASPYAATDLEGLNFNQYRDYIRITSKDFPPQNLVRADHADWSLEGTEISPYSEGPTISSYTASTPSDGNIDEKARVIFAVSSVYEDGSESSIGNPFRIKNIVNYTVTEGSVSIYWSADPDAVEYKVYRSVVSVQENLSLGSELGYAGRTRGTKFTDPNIVPDFGRVPQINFNPFSPGAITKIRITNGGTGYANGAAITMGGGGTGFDGYVIVDDDGSIVNIVIKNGGTGYVSPTVTVAGGTGLTATVEAREMTGTYPALSAIFQQRQFYAASNVEPISIWGSQLKRFGHFGSSPLVLDNDSFDFTIDTAAIAPIKHLMVTRGGLLAMTQDNIWLVNGGNNNSPITPTNALAESQTYTGVSDLRPIPIGSDILYVEGKGYAVRLLEYNEIGKTYSGDDKSILSNHLFGLNKRIIRWGYQESPFKVVWAVREDGALLAFTIVKAEEVFAWTPGATKGRFTDLTTVREVTEDRVYVTTERFINNRWTKFIERMDLRTFINVEDAWCVDAGLSLGSTSPDATLTIRHVDDLWSATASNSALAGSVGKILRAGNGIFRITASSEAYVELEMYSPPTNWIPEMGETLTFPILSGDWTLDEEVTTIGGLWHLEGEEVSILGDGNVFPRQVVENGQITLSHPVSRCIVGLPYTCRAKTLPMIVPDAALEGKRKRIPGIAVRLTKSRGLRFGNSYERTYAMKERTTEAWGRPTALQEGIRYQYIGTQWDEEGQTYFRLDDPLPVTLLGLVSDIEVGDESD